MTNSKPARSTGQGRSSDTSKPKFVLVTGNTYPVKDQLKALGARWNAAEKGWMVPAKKEDEARKLVAGVARKTAAHSDVGSGGQGRPSEDENSAKWEKFQPTDEQKALKEFVQSCGNNLFIEAGAGCGKTTVSLWLMWLLGSVSKTGLSIVYAAFNVDVKEDVAQKAPAGVDVLTMNGIGYRAYYQAKCISPKSILVDKNHIYTVFIQMFGEGVVRERSAFFAQVKDLIGKAKNALAFSEEDLQILCSDFEIDMNGETDEGVKLAMRVLATQAADRTTRKVMDFDDQKWLPVVQELRMPAYDLVVIDEAQDTGPLDLAMFKMLVEGCGARVIAVGDKRQAIYQFRGADEFAVDKIVETFDMTVLPLMTTFRCGKAIVREAQKIVPSFKAGENNHDGLVRSMESSQLLSQVRAGDFVISRTNAPLVSGCLQALARGIPAAIAGRDIGKTILAYAKKMRATDARDFEKKIAERLAKEIEKLEKKVPVNEDAIEAARDKAGCLLTIADNYDTMDEIYSAIDRLFSEKNDQNVVMFTTTHKAKGRERERVFLLRDTYLMKRKSRKTGEWMEPSIAEYNLLYVAQTRAKNELVYVTSK